MTTPTAQPGPDGYGIVTPEPITGTVALRPASAAAATGAQRPKGGPVDGALLWALVTRYLAFYVAFRTREELNRVTAWVFHACARKRGEMGMGPLIGNASPRLLVKSRKRGAGKSTLLRLIGILTGSSKAPRITAASFAQIISQAYETVCIDEGRLVFGAGAKQQDLQACVLDGYTPGTYYRVSRTKLSLFGPVAIATKESLITEATKAVDGDESSIGDMLDRCLTVTLTAPDMPPPEVGKRAQAEGEVLARALVAWTDAYRDALEQAAEDIADEDHAAAKDRARRGEKATETPRGLQIGRPLRAIGRVIDQQVITEARRDGKPDPQPQFEAEILACLGTQAEDIMAELEQLSEGWGDAQFTENSGEDDGWIASTSDPGDYEDEPEPPPAPVEGFIIRQVIKDGPGEPVPEELTGTYPDMETAQGVCEALQHIAGAQVGVGAWEPLTWQYRRLLADPEARMAIATTRPEGQPWPEITYAVTAAGK